MALRLRDTTGTSPHTLDETVYYCQNWRADAVAIIDDARNQLEQVRYSPYGVPFLLPAGDVTGVWGEANIDDRDAIVDEYVNATYDVRADLDLDGDVDVADITAYGGNSGGRGTLSLAVNGNRLGYAGYVADTHIEGSAWHVRHRVLVSTTGQWTRRDPLGYADGPSLHQYVRGRPVLLVDPSGLLTCAGNRCVPTFVTPTPVYGNGKQVIDWCVQGGSCGDPRVSACRAANDGPGCPEWWEDYQDWADALLVPLSNTSGAFIAPSVLQGAPHYVAVIFCNAYQARLRELGGDVDCNSDPRCQWLGALCRALNGAFNMRVIVCGHRTANGTLLRRPRVTYCPSTHTSVQCCNAIAPIHSTGIPIPAAPELPGVCDLPGYTCELRDWELPLRPPIQGL